MICDHCEKEMMKVTSCLEPVDKSALPPKEFHHLLRNCHDCRVEPGATHHPGCDMERCGTCGGQSLQCSCDGYWENRVRWTGMPRGYRECFERGWLCRDLHLDGTVPTPERPMKFGAGNMRWHVPCGPDDEGAHPDLNRWHAAGCPKG